MRYIRKGPAPACLDVYRRTPGADWLSVTGADKAELRRQLNEEQAGLCAYCTRRVTDGIDATGKPHAKIEHWDARSSGADPFHWPNLLLVCRGDLDRGQTCDAAPGDAVLTVHPARDEDLDDRVRYLGDGTIEIDAVRGGRRVRNGHQRDVDTLNLNWHTLRRNRRAVADAVVAAAQGADPTRLRSLLDAWSGAPMPEYAGVARYLLRRALSKRVARGKRRRVAADG